MNTTYNKSNLLKSLKQIIPEGYSMDREGDFYRIEANRKIEIGFSLEERYPHEVQFSSLSIRLLYPSVEQILSVVHSNLPNPTYGHDSDSSTFNTGFGRDVLTEPVFDNMTNTIVNDDVSFASIRGNLEALITAGLTFISTYQTLQDCYTYGESLSSDEFVYFYSPPASDRKAIVMKLLNLPYGPYLLNEITLYTNAGWSEEAAESKAVKAYLDSL